MAFGIVALAEVLLVMTAVLKLRAPGPAASALHQVGLEVPHAAVRLGAVAELVVGVGGLVTGRPIFSAGVALCYLVFAVFVARALGRPEPVSSCGCFGRSAGLRGGTGDPVGDTPPTTAHLAFNLVAVAVCVLAVRWPPPGAATVLRHQPLAGVPLVAFLALGAWLCWMLLALAPRTAAAGAAAQAPRTAAVARPGPGV